MVIPAGVTALVLLLALAGTRFVAAGVSPWPRFWGVVFFATLLWPIGLTLVGRVVGRPLQLAAGGLIVLLTAAQQFGSGSLPLPLVVRWSVSLAVPGDAIRRELALPPAGDAAWTRAWSRATSAAVAVCTEAQIERSVDVAIIVNEGAPAPLALAERSGKPDSVGWYNVPITLAQADARRPLIVVVRREGGSGPPARICGGQDDPTRSGWEGSARLRSGQWTTEQLADVPIPPIGGLPAPSRYYIELRLYDRSGRPHAGIFY